jgi:SAM-dependent methyltransferase
MVAKMVLPLLGGVPAVWTTSILFFQATLLLGYAYAHYALARLGPRRQAVLHAVVVLLPLAVLPIGLPGGWTPPLSATPIPWLLGLLAVSAGLPFFVVSTTGPLLQRWFAATAHGRASDPYFLFAASNVGSLLGLLAYPVVVERALSLHDQARLWEWGYLVLVVLTITCAVVVWRSAAESPPAASAAEPITRNRRARWLVLAFVPSSLMLGVTAQITGEVAPIPLFWVIGLALYLATLIIAFSRRRPAPSRALLNVLPVLVAAVVVVTFFAPTRSPWVLLLHLATFTVAALVCHGQLAADRPHGSRLTEYYLWLAAGGALGGVFNGIVAPVVFSRLVEYPMVLFLACALRPGLWSRPRFWGRPAGLAVLALAAFTLAAIVTTAGQHGVLRVERSFFGVYKVQRIDRWGGHFTALIDGNTLHGLQSRDPARADEPLLYFYRGGPAGQVFEALAQRRDAARVAVVGLGAGSLACYARPGDEWTFYEIDPTVERIARDPKLFTLLRRCAPRARVVLGDGRLALARSRAPRADLLVLDAFNSESLPVHLLTREALAIYLRRLAPGGLLLFNVSNHYLDLAPVLGRLAESARLVAFERDDSHAGREGGRAPSRWVVMARRGSDLGALATAPEWRRLAPDRGRRVWTDQYSNVLSVLRW